MLQSSYNQSNCPVCKFVIATHKSKPKSALSITKIMPDLRQQYENTDTTSPLAYEITLCPNCYYSTLSIDFHEQDIKNVHKHTLFRKKTATILFPDMPIKNPLNHETTLLSYLLAIDCYKLFPSSFPTFKQAICSLRASWLANDLFQTHKEQIYKNLSYMLYAKATTYYSFTLSQIQKNKSLQDKTWVGPDIQQNWGYEGILYITGYLNYLFNQQQKDQNKNKSTLKKIQQIMNHLQNSSKKPLAKLAQQLNQIINQKLENTQKQAL